MGMWNCPSIIGGDFNLVRWVTDKSNGVVNKHWADAFNNWINMHGLIELKSSSRNFTWSNNQENAILANIDRVFMDTSWDVCFCLIFY